MLGTINGITRNRFRSRDKYALPNRHSVLEFKPMVGAGRENICLVISDTSALQAIMSQPASSAKCYIDGLEARHYFYYFATAGIYIFPKGLPQSKYLSNMRTQAVNSAGKVFETVDEFTDVFGPKDVFIQSPMSLNRVYSDLRYLLNTTIVTLVRDNVDPPVTTIKVVERYGHSFALRFGGNNASHHGYAIAIAEEGVSSNDIKERKREIYTDMRHNGIFHVSGIVYDEARPDATSLTLDETSEYDEPVTLLNKSAICRLNMTMGDVRLVLAQVQDATIPIRSPSENLSFRLFAEGFDASVIDMWLGAFLRPDDNWLGSQIRRCIEHGRSPLVSRSRSVYA